jgi:hypothetical protein
MRNRRSFDCASRDKTARGFAQDDNSFLYRSRWQSFYIDHDGNSFWLIHLLDDSSPIGELRERALRETARREKQIPFGHDNQKGNGKNKQRQRTKAEGNGKGRSRSPAGMTTKEATKGRPKRQRARL